MVGEQPDRPRAGPRALQPGLPDEDVQPPRSRRHLHADGREVVLLGIPRIELDEADGRPCALDDAGRRRVLPGGLRLELVHQRVQGQGRVVGIPPLADVSGVPPGNDPFVIVIANPSDDQVAVRGDDVIHASKYRVTREAGAAISAAYDAVMRVLVVEDEPEVAGSLARGLAEAGMSVDVALSGEEALETLRSGLAYDVAVLDVMLGGDMDGIGLCRHLRVQQAPTAILMLTARDDVKDRLAGFDAGADDYLAKPFHFEEVLARVRALSRRRVAPMIQVLQAGNLSMDSGARQVMVAGDVVPTTRREYEILELFLRHPAQVLSKEQIHDAVWGDAQTVESGLVEVYAGKVRRKLQAAQASVLIETCRGIGYRLISGDAAAAL